MEAYFDFWPSRPSAYVFGASFVALLAVKSLLTAVLLANRSRLPLTAFKPSGGGAGAAPPLDPNLVWFATHFLANAVVCVFAFSDMVHVLLHPADSFRPSECLGHAVVMATHVFHVAFFKLDRADIIHHGLSVGVVGSMGYLVRWGALLHAIDFFICGLPGGLDYRWFNAAPN